MTDAGKDSIRTHFDRYAGQWHERLQSDAFSLRLRAVTEFVRGLPQRTVVDVGCGTGDYSTLFDPSVDYLGLDISPEMVERSRQLYPGRRFDVADGDSLSMPDGFAELVLDIAVIEYYDDPLPHMHELRRITKNGGHLIIAVPNGSNITRWMNEVWWHIVAGVRGFFGNPVPKRVKALSIRHRGKSESDMQQLAAKSGFELVSVKYVNTMIVPEVHRAATAFNRSTSFRISGRDSWRWLSRRSGTILVCLMRAR